MTTITSPRQVKYILSRLSNVILPTLRSPVRKAMEIGEQKRIRKYCVNLLDKLLVITNLELQRSR